MHNDRLGDYHYHLCHKCWRTTVPEDTDVEACPCSHCNETAVRKVIRPVTVDPQGIFKCGGKDSLSTWEEIKHRPRGSGF
ncbi:hypothetical protein NVP1077O_04 [Vibrio phage 1.077.O._10N.261.45.A10]|nr:hypothetical protein NVP1070O_04 [Vibrio phage 1.070.O._10N.261.45.B2]AUR85582.1 hypothetical protein NVP1077O_04 [Vibrio phage 1.077.O._10N.261.45.A10]